ncbi:hypothetical protein LPJ70_006177 [Coemansia sp. RSA 2708]|nr:hypothetical protein LPJ70_006177 [Coemansia sp. RSA 2708]
MTRLEVDTTPRAMLTAAAPLAKLKTAGVYGLPSPPDSPMLLTKAAVDAVEVTAEMEAEARRLSSAEAVSWERFKQLVDAKNLKPLGRSYAMQVTYEQHKIQMLREYGSIANYLINYALAEFIAETKTDGFDAGAALAVGDFMFRANDFPYHLCDNVEHWVLWCKKRLVPGFEAPAAAVEAIEQRFGRDVQWRYFVNPVHRQSVPQLSHAHVFIKRT